MQGLLHLYYACHSPSSEPLNEPMVVLLFFRGKPSQADDAIFQRLSRSFAAPVEHGDRVRDEAGPRLFNQSAIGNGANSEERHKTGRCAAMVGSRQLERGKVYC